MEKRRVTATTLKWIAFVSMVTDHVAYSIVNRIYLQMPDSAAREMVDITIFVMRLFGRLAFPIFCYLILEGISHTRSPLRYGLRLFVLAIVSEIPYDLVVSQTLMDWSSQNTVCTLLVGFLCIELMLWSRQKLSCKPTVCTLAWFVILIACLAIAEFGQTDYGALGVLTMVLMQRLLERMSLMQQQSQEMNFQKFPIGELVWNEPLCFIVALIPMAIVKQTELAAMFFAPVLLRYDHTRGTQGKYLFYVLYPLHLLLIEVVYLILFW